MGFTKVGYCVSNAPINVQSFGALGNTKYYYAHTVSISSGSTSLSASNSQFTSNDVGKSISVAGAGSAGGLLITTIAAYVSATQVTLAAAAGTTLSATGAYITYGTDDTVAIQAAIDSIPSEYPTETNQSKGGWEIFFPAGIYLISDTIDIGTRRVILRGSGLIGSNGTTIITNNKDLIMIDASTVGFDTFSVYGLQFQGPPQGTFSGVGSALLLGRAGQPIYDSRIEDCWFVQIPQAAIYGKVINGLHISNCAFENGGYGILVEAADIYNSAGNNVIENNRFSSIAYAGIKITAPYCSNMTIVGNLFTTCGTNIVIPPSTIAEGTAIYIANDDEAIRNTLIASNNFGNNYNDIILSSAGSDPTTGIGVIDTHIVSNSFDKTWESSINVSNVATTSIIGNKFNNVASISGLGNNAIVVGTGAETTVISNNTVRSYGAASENLYAVSLSATSVNTIFGQNDFSGQNGTIQVASGATYSLMPTGFAAKDALNYPASYLNGWSNVGAGYSDAAYWVNSEGMVNLTGEVTGGTINTILFQLPVGYRPAFNVRVPIANSGGAGYVAIDTSGNITLAVSSNTWVSLDGVSFVAA